ncbi:MAG: GNAT family N-acetyltransferase [Firmicutes bacterium]|nr:GNAT family N-acetyltransferase [Bacillota bacterium]
MNNIPTATIEDVPGIAKVHVDSWRRTYRGIVPDAVLDHLSYEEKEELWTSVIQRGKSRIAVAETPAGKIVGFASAGPVRNRLSSYQQELYAIYILSSHQRQGIGQRLVSEVAPPDHSSFLVWVLADNPSCRFYKRLGGKKIGTETITIGGISVEEVAYVIPSQP